MDLLGIKIEQLVDYLNTVKEDFPAAKQSNEDSTSKKVNKATHQSNQKRGQQSSTSMLGMCPHCSKEHASTKGDYSDCYHLKNSQKKQSKDSKDESWKNKKSKYTPKRKEQSYLLAESFQEMVEQASKSKKKSGMQERLMMAADFVANGDDSSSSSSSDSSTSYARKKKKSSFRKV